MVVAPSSARLASATLAGYGSGNAESVPQGVTIRFLAGVMNMEPGVAADAVVYLYVDGVLQYEWRNKTGNAGLKVGFCVPVAGSSYYFAKGGGAGVVSEAVERYKVADLV